MRTQRLFTFGIATLAVFAAGCSTTSLNPGSTNIAGTQPADIEFRQAISQLAKLHSDRTQLSGFAAIPFLHTVDKDVRVFTDWLGAQNKIYLDEIQTYAKKKNIDVRFKFGPDLFSQSQMLMEKNQGDALMNSGGNFSLYVVMYEFIDHHFGKSLLETMLKNTPQMDAGLREILMRDLQMHNQAIAKLAELLKKFKIAR
jgi:hypothetical protein